nr:MAG TPA: hypothetical protein [Caudoviricetes sp.]
MLFIIFLIKKKDNPRRIGMLTTLKQLPHSGTQRYSFPSYLFVYFMMYVLFCQHRQNGKYLSFISSYGILEMRKPY